MNEVYAKIVFVVQFGAHISNRRTAYVQALWNECQPPSELQIC